MAKLNITWAQFAICNENPTKSFEDMCRKLFRAEFLNNSVRTHSNHNNAGIEVLPVLEPKREGGMPQKRISFQSKYVEQPSYAYSEFQKSAKITAENYKGELDLVYLFCNKTLSTTAKGYSNIVKIHADAGIETWPISDSELLDMVSDYPDIAEYYFQARIVADTTSMQPVFFRGVPAYIITEDQVSVQSTNKKLLHVLVGEKIINCRKYALTLEMESLKMEVDKLISSGAEDNEFYFYQFLIQLHEGKSTSETIKKCTADYKREAEWLIKLYDTPSSVSAYELSKHMPVVQIFTVKKLFDQESWEDVIILHDQIKDDIDQSIKNLFDMYYGLSLLNIQENQKAEEVFHILYERRMLFYNVCASIRIENLVYQSGKTVRHDELEKLINQLDAFKEIKQYRQQELFVSALRIETLYHLGIRDKNYLEIAIGEYESLSVNVRSNVIIQYYYALCLELNGCREQAIDVYENMDWRSNTDVSERYMICLILNEQPQKAIEAYDQISQKNVHSESVYLFALNRNRDKDYMNMLIMAVDKYKHCLTDLLAIAYFTDTETQVKDVIIPALKEACSVEGISSLLFYQKLELITLFSHCREIELIDRILNTIEDISAINTYVAGEIYKGLFEIANREYVRKEKDFAVPEVLEVSERIADRFLEAGLLKKNYLQIKILCAGAKNMPYSFLKYSKELFDITHDVETARSIIAVLIDRRQTNTKEYDLYLEVLEKSDEPEHCMLVAYAMLVLGRIEAADFYAYKSLYLLNGGDNYHIYQSYFGFCYCNMHLNIADTNIRTVRGGVVVFIEEFDADDKTHFEICLDQEVDFSDNTNRSMGIEHIIASDPDYVKLLGTGIGQVLEFRHKKIRIVEIMPRNQFGLRFILKKMQERPGMFRGAVWMISTDNINDMIEQIKQVSDNSEQIKSLLAAYNFENNEIGLPIDTVAFGDYRQYISTLKYLLYYKDEAFYAGQPIYENEEGNKYVPGLATLMLLSIMGHMDILYDLKNEIIIPESYEIFFKDEYSKAVGLGRRSAATISVVDDKPIIMEVDKDIPLYWERILEFCKCCQIKKITDQERIDFQIVDGMSGERLILGLGINSIHLDALILSKRDNATFLCDDLFFRKIATLINIRNVNIVSLVLHNANLDKMVPIIKEFSMTNYIYVPLRARNADEFLEILQNLMNGEKKKALYGDIIRKALRL